MLKWLKELLICRKCKYKNSHQKSPKSPTPRLDEEMVLLMELENEWPHQTDEQRAQVRKLLDRGVGERVDLYLEEKLRFDPYGVKLSSLEHTYFHTG